MGELGGGVCVGGFDVSERLDGVGEQSELYVDN